ncbi:hypothetical protein FRC17_001920 [Serendipita sp. 399]|nr:hypothetical protein FRC17_001920 [Serendipita sp. 399]
MPTVVEKLNHTIPRSVVSGPPSSSSPSRRAIRKTLNDALAIASNAVQLDAEGDYTRSVEAYQKSVDLLEEGLQMMHRQPEQSGRDMSHEIAQLEDIREKYKARIAQHARRKIGELAAALEAIPHLSTVSMPSPRGPRSPQSTSMGIPPSQPPPSTPLPPTPDSRNSINSTFYRTGSRGISPMERIVKNPSTDLSNQSRILQREPVASRSAPVNHGFSTPNLQQTTQSFLQLDVPSQEPLSTTSRSTTPLIEIENGNEDEGKVPDLTGSVNLLNRDPIFSGTYSSVYKGMWQGQQAEDALEVAVKVIRAVGTLKATRRKFRREAEIWSQLSHANVMPLYGVCMDGDFGAFGALISPWCRNGNSAEYTYKIEEPSRRIHLANILIDDSGEARLCDFGLVRLVQEYDVPSGMTTTTAHTGTARYLAPELVVSDDPKPSTETDCHALGCIALEFAYRRPPYAHRNSNTPVGPLYADIIKGVPPCPRPVPVYDHDGHDLLWDLLEACWNADPQQRPSSTQIYNYLSEHEATILEALTSGIDIF